MKLNRPRRSAAQRLPAPLLGGLIAATLLGGAAGCDVDAPPRLTSNQRSTTLELDAGTVPGGSLTVAASLQGITVSLDRIPSLSEGSSEIPGFVYEGWLAYDDLTLGRVAFSTGRFRVDAGLGDPLYPRGATSFTYDFDGTFAVGTGGSATGDAQALPDSVDLSTGLEFFLAIEPDPPAAPPRSPTPIHLLVLPGMVADSASTADLTVPADFGQESQGVFDRMQSHVMLNTVTGEYSVSFQLMSFFNRPEPGGATDPGLIYQAWFVDDDTDPPRFFSIARFNANLAGDAGIATSPSGPFALTVDSDGDGIPELLDFERVVVSIEPDGITESTPFVGSGLDTSPGIFPINLYQGVLPDVLP